MQQINHEDAIVRIAVDYIEMPDLIVTARQATRLWDIPVEVCNLALATLVQRGFLVQTRAGAFLRSGAASASVPLAQAS